jgi:hypothetical protein
VKEVKREEESDDSKVSNWPWQGERGGEERREVPLSWYSLARNLSMEDYIRRSWRRNRMIQKFQIGCGIDDHFACVTLCYF